MRKHPWKATDFLHDKICPICGKSFVITTSEWIYKRDNGKKLTYFCSWKCMREDERIRFEANPKSHYRIDAGVK